MVEVDGYDFDEIKIVIEVVCVITAKFLLLCCKIIIGYGLFNKVGSHSSYGVLLGEEEVALTCEVLEWEFGLFEIFEEIY